MNRLPVIVGFGGYNAAGRSSFHQAFQRMVCESLPQQAQTDTVLSLACLMKLVRFEAGQYWDAQGQSLTPSQVVSQYRQQVLDGTLVRYYENPDVPAYQDAFYDRIAVKSAGQLPSGFNPGDHYRSQFHPRAVQLAVMAASDAVKSIGIPWQLIMDQISADEVGVYSGSGMSQLDDNSNRGLLQARLQGKRVTSKQLAMGFSTMPTDFINAYVLGSLGATGTITGACASFLYTLRQGIEDIMSGRRRVVLVGSSEAPLTQEVMDGYAAMGALATAQNLCKLDNTQTPDYRRASRPFAENCGFTLGESAQYVVLMDDALAIQLGARIQGAVPHVFANADGIKRSISSPGAGNYITFAKAVAAAQAIVGERIVKQHSFILAHGSSTPQNRVTESVIFDRVAKAFDIEQWPVVATKAFVGHSIAPASGDQLVTALGAFHYGLIPGIKTATEFADDIAAEYLSFSTQDREAQADLAFINSKGFGGNNATAVVLAPQLTKAMLVKRYGQKAYAAYQHRNEQVSDAANEYQQQAATGHLNPIYRYGEPMVEDQQVEIAAKHLSVAGYKLPISLDFENPFSDMI